MARPRHCACDWLWLWLCGRRPCRVFQRRCRSTECTTGVRRQQVATAKAHCVESGRRSGSFLGNPSQSWWWLRLSPLQGRRASHRGVLPKGAACFCWRYFLAIVQGWKEISRLQRKDHHFRHTPQRLPVASEPNSTLSHVCRSACKLRGLASFHTGRRLADRVGVATKLRCNM